MEQLYLPFGTEYGYRLGAAPYHGDISSGYPPGTSVVPGESRPTAHSPTPLESRSELGNMMARAATPKWVLLIIRCNDPLMWYSQRVGYMVEYCGVWPGDGFKSRDAGGHINIVKFTDAIVIPNPEAGI